jgi:ATP-binding cassette, subfamily B, bacterial
VTGYRGLLRYARPYRAGWLRILLLSAGSSAAGLLQPWPMQILVDHVLGGRPLTGAAGAVAAWLPGAATPAGALPWVVAASLLIWAAGSALDALVTLTWVRVGQSMVYDLAAALFAALTRHSLLFHRRRPTGDLVTRVTGDAWAAYTVAEAALVAPGRALVTTVGALLVLTRLDAPLALLAVAGAPLLAGASYLLGRRVRLAARARRQSESRVQAHVQQTLRNLPAVQAFGQETRERRRFLAFSRAAAQAQQHTTALGQIYGLGAGLVTTLVAAALLWIGGHDVLAGRLSLGSLLVFLSYLALLQGQFKALADTNRIVQGARAGLDRVLEVLDAPPDVVDRPGAPALPRVRGAVEFEGVTFGYEPGQAVLRGISLRVAPGQMVALVGPSGVGKTTLVGLIPRFFDPARGRVLVDGVDVRTVSLASLRAQVALLLQEPALFPVSVAENIAYGRPDASRAAIMAAARDAEAHDFILDLPEGYETVLGEDGATLSGGQRQRLAIARALLKDAPILILDEPTSALDAATEAAILAALRRLMAGRTTFVIAHRLSTIRDADRIAVLQDGAIVEYGAHSALLARDGVYARLYATPGAGAETRATQPVAEGLRRG